MGGYRQGRPPLAWSLTRQRTLERCPRRYWLKYYGGYLGWKADAAPRIRRIHALGKLVTLPIGLGAALHSAARGFATAIQARAALPSLEVTRREIRAHLNWLVRSSRDPEEFLRNPRNPMLQEVWYDWGLTEDLIHRTSMRVDECSLNLHEATLWDELRQLPNNAILLVDSLEVQSIEHQLVYAAPDLAYFADHETGVIVDFKSGSAKDDELHEQVSLYALFVRQMLQDRAPKHWRARILLLADGTEREWELGEEDFEAAALRVQSGSAAMRALLQDEASNEPLPLECFPLTERRYQCPRCPFWDICEPAIRGPAASRARDSLDVLRGGHIQVGAVGGRRVSAEA